MRSALSAFADGLPLQTTYTLPNGVTVGVEQLWPLLALPVGVGLLYLLILRRDADDSGDRADTEGQIGSASTRSRRLLALSRLVIVVLVVLSATAPYAVATRETAGQPQVTLLTDQSDSMRVTDADGAGLAEAIESEGVPVRTATIGQGTDSRLGDAIGANLRENGTVVVLSDGRVTGGRTLAETADRARALNATISRVRIEPERTERYVAVNGPAKTSVGIESQFLVSVDGVNLPAGDATLRVEVDGQQVLERPLAEGGGRVEFTHTFEEVGSHEIRAEVATSDQFDTNDVFYKSVRVVERPRILYVSRGSYPFRSYLSDLYDVERADSIPEDLSPYYAVVVQDTAARDLGNVDSLQRFVIDGGGLLMVGGDNAFEGGGYDQSPVASMLPVQVGEGSGGSSNIVLLIDVSGSAEQGMTVQKAVSLDVLDQLGDENRVGLVAFNQNAYRVADIRSLSDNRAELEDRIRRLQAGGATNIALGLQGAQEMLAGDRGTVILISDGADTASNSDRIASQLGTSGTRVVSVGTGPRPNGQVLGDIARESGGSYLRATETDRLRLLFGGASRQFEGEGLTVVDGNTFITSGVELTATPARVNDVSMKPGGDFLVASDDGTPAVASWRYGLGRVVTVTAYGDDGSLDGLLSRPDSLLLTKATNYAIGDPERRATGVTEIGDTRVGEETVVVYRGDQRPEAEEIDFRQTSENVYRASVTPTETGFVDVLDAQYAANYEAEYAGFGSDPALSQAVTATNGRAFTQGEAGQIAEYAREQSTRVRRVETDLTWALLTAALLLYLLEVVARRIQVYRGRTRNEGGLP
jgi:Mg-chelatase subunit ChlD